MNDINVDYYFERLTAHNFDQFYRLFTTVFKSKKTKHDLKKKYNTKHLIEGYWVYMAFEKKSKKAIASFGVIPWMLVSNTEKILSAQASDAMVLKVHRSKGLFLHLHFLVANLLKESSITFFFGFANAQAYPIYKKKLNWRFTSPLYYYSIATKNKLPIRRILYKFETIRKIHNLFVNRIFTKYQVNIREGMLPNDFKIGTLKDTAFYNYKWNSAHKLLQIKDAYFLVKITNRLLIGDFKVGKEISFEEAFHLLSKLASLAGIQHIDFMCTAGIKNDLFSRKNKEKGTLPVGFFEISSSGINFESIGFSTLDLDTF